MNKMGFIELTSAVTGKPIYINIGRIEAVSSEEKGTSLWVAGESDNKYLVIESYDQVKVAIMGE